MLGALAPSRGKTIATLATSAMFCGFISCVLDLSCFPFSDESFSAELSKLLVSREYFYGLGRDI